MAEKCYLNVLVRVEAARPSEGEERVGMLITKLGKYVQRKVENRVRQIRRPA